MAREIPLTRGKVAIVDDGDYDRLMRYSWRAAPCCTGRHELWYAATSVRGKDGKFHTAKMHNLLQRLPRRFTWDHRDLDGLNNRRSNLRPATPQQQMANRRPSIGCRFRGVHKAEGRYRAAIGRGDRLNLGSFKTEEAAARAWDAAAFRRHGDFARLNFPGERLWDENDLAPFRRQKLNRSGYRGVSNANKKNPRGMQCWYARLTVDGVEHTRGPFRSVVEAARAWDELARSFGRDESEMNFSAELVA